MICAAPATATLRIVTAAPGPDLRSLLRDTLEDRCGHQLVAERTSGADLVRSVLAEEPDVVVFDVDLPHLNGLDALQQIYRERPVAAVALTTEQDQDRVRLSLDEYYLTYLVKPIAPYQLEPAISVAWSRFELFHRLSTENATLRRTIQERKIIERAKGVLMQRHRWSEADAFRRLQRGAMNRRTTMVHLAEAVLNGRHVNL